MELNRNDVPYVCNKLGKLLDHDYSQIPTRIYTKDVRLVLDDFSRTYLMFTTSLL